MTRSHSQIAYKFKVILEKNGLGTKSENIIEKQIKT